MAVSILADDGQYRLISDGQGRYAVIEARADKVYALEPHHRHYAPDNADGMLQVVEAGHGWASKQQAWEVFSEMVADEERYAQIIW